MRADARERAEHAQAAAGPAAYAAPAPGTVAGDFAIGLRAIDAADWLEGGEADPAARKDALRAAAAPLVWVETAGSRPAQAEALALVEGATGGRGDARLEPLWAASRLIPDDLCLMERREGGWTLTALSLCAGSLFTAEEAIGRTLAQLHAPVPGFAERLLKRTTRVFDGLREGLILERRNWSVVPSGALHLPDGAAMRAALPEITTAAAGDRLFLRMERQTLRRLPATGAALFTIRIHRHPLALLRDRPERLAAFAAAWRGAAPDFRAYKGLLALDPLVEAFLQAAGSSASSAAAGSASASST